MSALWLEKRVTRTFRFCPQGKIGPVLKIRLEIPHDWVGRFREGDPRVRNCINRMLTRRARVRFVCIDQDKMLTELLPSYGE